MWQFLQNLGPISLMHKHRLSRTHLWSVFYYLYTNMAVISLLVTKQHLYLIIGLSRCHTTHVAYVQGRTVGRGRHGRQPVSTDRLRAGIDGSGGGGGVAYEDERAGTSRLGRRTGGQADGPNPAKIANSAILARYSKSFRRGIVIPWDTKQSIRLQRNTNLG